MSLRNLRIEWERQEDLIELANQTLQQEQQKATLQSSLTELNQKSDNIHASILFQPSWKPVLNILCNKICSFAPTFSGGWMDFAARLNLDQDFINSVKHNNVTISENKAEIILNEFAKVDTGTIDKIFKALDDMMRYDIIETLFPLTIELCNAACSNHNHSQDAGYSSEENNSRTLPMPVNCKDAVLHNLANNVLTREVQSHSFNLIDEGLQKSQEIFSVHQTKESKNVSKKRHSKIVLLTFAEDGEAVAKELASALRNSFDKNHRAIGVVILNENKYLIADDPCIKITDCFNQVDFVIPIITEKYVDLVFPSIVGNTDVSTPSPSVHPDAYYAPLIFRLMSTEYTRRHCLNKRFRSIIPNDQKGLLYSDYSIMNIPFLSPWCMLKDAIEAPRRALLLRNKR